MCVLGMGDAFLMPPAFYFGLTLPVMPLKQPRAWLRGRDIDPPISCKPLLMHL
jgi:hypothetical protein